MGGPSLCLANNTLLPKHKPQKCVTQKRHLKYGKKRFILILNMVTKAVNVKYQQVAKELKN